MRARVTSSTGELIGIDVRAVQLLALLDEERAETVLGTRAPTEADAPFASTSF
jgi:hypothetical protein